MTKLLITMTDNRGNDRLILAHCREYRHGHKTHYDLSKSTFLGGVSFNRIS
jgi:hypothetical protein